MSAKTIRDEPRVVRPTPKVNAEWRNKVDDLQAEVARWQAIATRIATAGRDLMMNCESEKHRRVKMDEAIADFDAAGGTNALDEMLLKAVDEGQEAMMETWTRALIEGGEPGTPVGIPLAAHDAKIREEKDTDVTGQQRAGFRARARRLRDGSPGA